MYEETVMNIGLGVLSLVVVIYMAYIYGYAEGKNDWSNWKS